MIIATILFTFANYSKYSWSLFYSIGGLTLAKVGPEILGLFFYIFISIYFLKRDKISFKEVVGRKDFWFLALLLLITFISRLDQFKTTFFRDDYFFWIIRKGAAAYSVYDWGPWLSSHPGWVWELSRLLGGLNPFYYQLATLISHSFFVVGIYLLAKYISKNRYIGIISAIFFSITTIHFEAFEWLSHVSNFGWQGAVMTMSLLLLLIYLDKFKGKRAAYPSVLLMTAAFGSGIARSGVIFPIILITDFLYAFKYISVSKIRDWILGLIKREWLGVVLIFVFLLTRGLLLGASTRIENITAPHFLTFLWLFGTFFFPPEFIGIFSFISKFWLGTITIIISSGSLLIFALYIFVKRNSPWIIKIGLIWTLLFCLFFTYWAPHVPVTYEALRLRYGSHHLAYPAVAGVSLIYGYVIFNLFNMLIIFLKGHRVNMQFIKIIITFLACLTVIGEILLLKSQYRNFIQICLKDQNYQNEICKP